MSAPSSADENYRWLISTALAGAVGAIALAVAVLGADGGNVRGDVSCWNTSQWPRVDVAPRAGPDDGGTHSGTRR